MPDNPSPALLSFREFLKIKEDEFGARDRRQKREEWIVAIRHLLDQVQTWLHRADPEQILDVEPYEVSRTEAPLGTYAAPALRISLGPGQVDLIPMGRYVSTSATRAIAGAVGEPAGRVDLTDGYRKIPLYRQLLEGGLVWRYQDDRGISHVVDQESFVPILQELLS